MSEETYHFRIGDMQCISISDGSSNTGSASVYFANAPTDALAQALAAHGLHADAMPSYINVLYIRTPEHQILADTGLGQMTDPTLGRLMHNLNAEGIVPEDIDIIIITHAHGDHIGGLTASDGRLVFANARCFMWKTEWEHWTSEETLASIGQERAERVRQKLLPIKDRLTLIDVETEVVPGVHVLPAAGHTPGHAALLLESRGERLLHIVDAAHQVIQCQHPDWSPIFDSQPELSPITRRRLFERAAVENLLTMAYHFPFPGLGHVITKGDAFAWEPLQIE